MDASIKTPLRIGDWTVDPASERMFRGVESVRLEPRMLGVLLCLADRPGDVVSIDDLLERAWPGVIVTPDSVYQAVTGLRRLLKDDSKQPAYIATVPRRGYRLVAAVHSVQADTGATGAAALAADPVVSTARLSVPASRSPLTGRSWWVGGGAIALAASVAVAVHGRWPLVPAPSAGATAAMRETRSIAVLPFLDLTDAMNEEPFADGMTEELIDRLSKVANLQVSAPTASFYFKGKQASVGDIGRSLGVTYVLDGSVRKSESTLRIAARLVRADDGFVIWSESYDRPQGDRLRVQDEIAAEATKALAGSID